MSEESVLHIYRADSIGSIKFPEIIRKFFPTCNCKTLEIHRYYDSSCLFHRKYCKWLWWGRSRKARNRYAGNLDLNEITVPDNTRRRTK